MNEEKGLIKQTSKDKALTLIESSDKKKLADQLAEQQNKFSQLFPKLLNHYLGINERDLKKQGLGDNGLVQLYREIAKRIEFEHKFPLASAKLWRLVFWPTFKAIDLCGPLGAIPFLATIAMLFIVPIQFYFATGSALATSLVVISEVASIAAMLKHYYDEGPTNEGIAKCDQCRYLQLYHSLKRQGGLNLELRTVKKST